MTAFPDPTVRLNDVVVKLRGLSTEDGASFQRIVIFPRVIRDQATYNRFPMVNLPEGVEFTGSGAYLGVLCDFRRDKGEVGRFAATCRNRGADRFIYDPMLAYLVDLIHYGFTQMKEVYWMKPGKEWDPPEPHFPEGFDAPTPNKTLREALSTTQYTEGVKVGWPTFSVGPRGYRGSLHEGGNNAILNAYLYAIQFGAGSLKRYDNEIPDIRPDDTAERLEEVRYLLNVAGVEVVEDSGWKGDRFNCSIVDYKRTVKFKEDLESEDLALFVEMLRLDNCPGWTGIEVRRNTHDTIQFSTTMDSSG